MAALSNGNGIGNGTGNGSSPLPERLPPHNLKAERGVLGSILLNNDVLHDVIGLLKIEDFYRDIHQIAYRAIRDMYDLGKAIDVITLPEELTRRNQYASIGGDDFLTEIVDAVPHPLDAKYYAEIVRQKSIARQLIDAANEILHEGYSNTFTSDELLEAAERRIFNIAEDQTTRDTLDLSDIVTQAMDRIAARSEQHHPLTGVGTGFIDLDDVTGGFQPEQLIIIAARPSMGKTAASRLPTCCRFHVAVDLKITTLFVSLEMNGLEVAERLLCARSRVDGDKLRRGQGLGTREMALLGKSYEELRCPMFIDDTPSRNMLQITANARRLKMRKNLGLIVVDYIQLIDSEESRDSRQEQIAKISRRLKTLAPRAQCTRDRPLPAQPRCGESRGSKSPPGRSQRIRCDRAGRRRRPLAPPA